MLKLGRLPRTYRPEIAHLSSLIAGKNLPPPPPSVDYSKALPENLGAMNNDRLGCCTCSAVGHAIQAWTANANPPMVTEPDSSILALYEAACGYNPSDPSTDQGGNEQAVLTYLLKSGAPTQNGPHKIDAFFEVDVRNLDDVKRTIADCGLAYIGFNVPDYLLHGLTAPNSDWDTRPGAPRIEGGHAVILVGYDSVRATIVSWGNLYTMTWRFFQRFTDECYGIIDPLWVEKTGKTPFGLTEADTVEAMRALAA